VVVTDRKAFELLKSERRQKRGGAKVLDEAALQHAAAEGSPLAEILGQEPSPEFAAEVAEEFRRLLNALDDATLRRVALQKMEGYTIKEIAEQEGVAPRTVQRWLQLIRRTWERELQP
jgi:DNA-directed RNA polymerase specialized sigma24 family protein